MYIERLKLSNFKNYSNADLIFSDKINCFIGNNGVGKTNLLDALYYLAFCKSYFNSIDTQNIKHEEDFFAIHGDFLKNGDSKTEVVCIQKRSFKKIFKKDDKEYDRLSDHIGLYPLVMISPYDRDLINEGSEIRRKLMDTVLSQFDKIYLDDLINYNRALQQRNILLKNFNQKNYFSTESLEIWDEQLIQYGEKIFARRHEFIDAFIPLFQKYFNYISQSKETVSIGYESQLLDRSLGALLSTSRDKDRILKYTTCGTHKDDLLFEIDQYPVKRFGSQGQQKSYVIALKLAQYEYTRNIKGFKPMLLLDDIFDKLDEERVKQIIHLVNDNNFGQVFITDTQQDRIANIFREVNISHKIFNVEAGDAREVNL